MTGRIFLKLIVTVTVLLTVALVSADLLTSRVAESNYIETLRRELTDKSRTLALVPESNLRTQLHEYAAGADARVTLVAPDGGFGCQPRSHGKSSRPSRVESRTARL